MPIRRDRFEDQHLALRVKYSKGIRRRKSKPKFLTDDIVADITEEVAELNLREVSTVNAYLAWLHDKKIPYEVRVNSAGWILVKGITLGGKYSK